MARFASDCLEAMPIIVSRLETTLGPDTGDLGIRIGIHSGAVTAGVLRGDKGRFQLFGDTMNTASRMESTGQTNRIQISPETAQFLRAARKDDWFQERDVKVFVKGKGHLQTFWLKNIKPTASVASSSNRISGPDSATFHAVGGKDKTDRLVDWCSEELGKLLKKVVARRKAKHVLSAKGRSIRNSMRLSSSSTSDDAASLGFARPLDEVKDVVTLPEVNLRELENEIPSDSIQLHKNVTAQLHKYVSSIATMYKQNPFHNFEHASHVAMSVTKLLTRIMALEPDGNLISKTGKHDKSFGITADPLTQFAAFYSALIQ